MKLATINIERSNHLERVIEFLAKARPDTVCLQELMREDVGWLQERLDLPYAEFAAMCFINADGCFRELGVGIISRWQLQDTEILHYAGQGSGRGYLSKPACIQSAYETNRYIVLAARIALPGQVMTIATTHFPWTPNGQANDIQRNACRNLIAGLAGRELILAGDFNTPRGGEIFTELSAVWQDNIPQHYQSSLDPDLHRAGPLALMVDGIFTTPTYDASDVELHSGVSDHCAITASVRLMG